MSVSNSSTEVYRGLHSDSVRQQARLLEILRRFVNPETDKQLSDLEFVSVVMQRYQADRTAPLIDPNE